MNIIFNAGHVIWKISWQISILVVVIWFMSLVIKKSQPVFHYWLWCIVLVRLLLPFNVTVPIGTTHYFRTFAEEKIISISNEVSSTNTYKIPFSILSSSEKETSETIPIHLSFAQITSVIWFFSMILLGVLVCLWLIHVKIILKKCSKVERIELLDFINKKRKELNIKHHVEIFYLNYDMPIGPTVTGLLHPKILIPRNIADEWSRSEYEPILLHELVHIKRYDLFLNLIQITVQIVFFFHPLVWFTNWKIREKREELCDDITIKMIQNKRKRYSLSILNVLEGILYEPILSYVDIGFSERKSSLAKRIIRIANQNYKSYQPLSLSSIIVLIAIATLSISIACDKSVESVTGVIPSEKTSLNTVSDNTRVELIVLDNNQYKVNGTLVDQENLEITLKNALENNEKKAVLIIVPPYLSAEKIKNLMDKSYNLGSKYVGIRKLEK